MTFALDIRNQAARARRFSLPRFGFGPLKALGRSIVPLAVLAGAIWAGAYMAGIAPWLGTAQRTEVYESFPRHAEGMTIGFETFAFMRGQRVFIDYDLERAAKGTLTIRVIRNGALRADPKGSHLVQTMGPGRFEYVIPRSGTYSIVTRCHATTNGCDIGYTATWGANSVFATEKPASTLALVK